MLFALSDAGHLEAAYALLMCEECPSWLYQVDRGATTMWERWDGIRPDGSVNLGLKGEGDPGMLSFNHYAYGAVASWLHEVVAGLTVRELPARTVTIAPNPGGALTRARATLATPGGDAALEWQFEDGVLKVTAIVPPGYDARLRVPRGFDGEDCPIGAGSHSWQFRPS